MEIKDLDHDDFENDMKLISDTIFKFGVTMDELSDIHISLDENKEDKSD